MLKEKFRKEINMNCYALSKTLNKYFTEMMIIAMNVLRENI